MQIYSNREAKQKDAAGAEAESESTLKLPLSRRQAIGGLAFGLASLWGMALATRPSGAKPQNTGEESDDKAQGIPLLSHSVVVAATPETVGLASAVGGALLKRMPDTRFRVKEGDFGLCMDRLIKGEVAVTMLPRVMSAEESLKIARRYCQLTQIPVAATKDCFERLNQPGIPADKVGLYFLYVRLDATRGRVALREFIQLCQFGTLNVLRDLHTS